MWVKQRNIGGDMDVGKTLGVYSRKYQESRAEVQRIHKIYNTKSKLLCIL